MKTSWIGVDWGTSNLRVFAVGNDNKVGAESLSDKGMATLRPEQFETALLELIDPWLIDDTVTPVFACGMVGARQGWQEASYRAVPCSPISDAELTTVHTLDKRIAVRILPGLCQMSPSDVMRGEETQLAGLLQDRPAFQGSVCLPGTHSKWVAINQHLILSFNTYMTGELFSLLSNQSVLRHSMNTKEWDDDAFLQSALNSVEAPDKVPEKLFGIRAASLLENTNPAISRSTLSGMLVGYEIGSAKRYWHGQDIVLIGAPTLTSMYRNIFMALDVSVDTLDAGAATIAGLTYSAKALLRT